MEKQEPFQLDVVSIRLVKNAPLFSDRKITGPKDAVSLVGEMLCEMDREVVCVINLKSDGTQGRYDYDRPYLKAVLPFGNTAR